MASRTPARLGLAALLAACSDPTPEPERADRPSPAQASGPASAAEAARPDRPPRDEDAGTTDAAAPPAAEADAAEPPPDYGVLHPPVPPPADEALTMHGLAGYEVVAIYAEPDMAARKLGYLRLGQRLRVTPKVERKDGDDGGCPKGWHHLEGGGFACASKGLVVGTRPPYMHREPLPPAIDDPTPYAYAYVRRWNSPMFWRIPTAEERREAERIRAERETARLAAEAAARGEPPPADPASGGTKPADPASGGTKPAESASAGTKPADPAGAQDGGTEPKKVVAAEPAGTEPKKVVAAAAAPADPKPVVAQAPAGETPSGGDEPPAEEPEPIVLPLNPSTPWLEKGFFVSLAEKEKDDHGRTYWRTARGGYVAASDVTPYKAKDFRGQVLDGLEHPYGWAMDRPTTIYRLDDQGRLRRSRKVEQRTFLDLDEAVEHGKKTYFRLPSGELVRADHVRVPVLRPPPEGLAPWEKWIDVDLGRQILVAYEGSTPVFATLVSTGRKGTEEESFETPTGTFRIRSKHVSTTMDGNTASDGNYSIQDVPWAMFFEGSYALHGAFWHRGFGYRRSHGCVNLGPSDAKWLFFWTTPYLPERWHGVFAQPTVPGTTVVVHE